MSYRCNTHHRPAAFVRGWYWLVLGGLALLSSSGCNVLGPAAGVLTVTKVKPSYTGFEKQTTAVMVWADNGITIDYPAIQTEVANGLGEKMTKAIKDCDEFSEMKLIPVTQTMQFQDDHPEMGGHGAGEWAVAFAHKEHITRFVYIELISMTTHPEISLELLKGTAVANVYVVELDGDSPNPKIAYRDRVTATFPDKGPAEGELDVTEEKIYTHTLDALTDAIGQKFIEHEPTPAEKEAMQQ